MKSLQFLAHNVFKIALGIISLVASVTPVTAQIHRLNSDEMTLFKRIAANAEQQRDGMALDPVLCIVARKRVGANCTDLNAFRFLLTYRP